MTEKKLCPQYIAIRRREIGMTQAELAAKIGIYTNVLSAYETGSTRPRRETFNKILAALSENKTEKTNGDNIRAMSDEELVLVISCPKPNCAIPPNDRPCDICKMEWLKAKAVDNLYTQA